MTEIAIKKGAEIAVNEGIEIAALKEAVFGVATKVGAEFMELKSAIEDAVATATKYGLSERAKKGYVAAIVSRKGKEKVIVKESNELLAVPPPLPSDFDSGHHAIITDGGDVTTSITSKVATTMATEVVATEEVATEVAATEVAATKVAATEVAATKVAATEVAATDINLSMVIMSFITRG